MGKHTSNGCFAAFTKGVQSSIRAFSVGEFPIKRFAVSRSAELSTVPLVALTILSRAFRVRAPT